MIRWHRMLGDPTLWVPGRDHAGHRRPAGRRARARQEGLTRHDLGRESSWSAMWDWMDRYGKRDPVPALSPGRLRGLGPREVHDGPAPVARGADGVRPAVREGADLPGLPHHQLVPGLPDGALGPRGGAREVTGQLTYVRYPLSRLARQARPSTSRWRRRAPRRSLATPASRCTRTIERYTAPDRAHGDRAARRARDPDRRPTTWSIWSSAPARSR